MSARVKVKICGVKRPEDARAAAEAGADAIGLNFVAGSPRFLAGMHEAQGVLAGLGGVSLLKVGVFVNPEPAVLVEYAKSLGLSAVQLHGDETAETARALKARLDGVAVWKAFRIARAEDLRAVAGFPCDAVLLDARPDGSRGGDAARGGTGKTFDWALLDGFARPAEWVLAGGLTPENVAEAVRRVRPPWVDTASGVESAPGVKDTARMRAFVEAARKSQPFGKR